MKRAKLGVSSRGMGSLQRGSNGQAMRRKRLLSAPSLDIVADIMRKHLLKVLWRIKGV